jgi:putative pyruvate formate lyase activating enzyme
MKTDDMTMNINPCGICPRNCGARRLEGKRGACGAGASAAVAAAQPHFWEEPCISGTKGSGTVFFSGCSLKCVYCQNRQISVMPVGKEMSVLELRDLFLRLSDMGVHNINLVNPTHYAMQISQALDMPLPVPVVYNTGGYEKTETLKALEGKIQVYLPDLKYFDNALAEKWSNAPDYFKYATEAILEMYRQTGDFLLDGDGLLIKGVLIRHLVLPGCIDNTKGVIRWLGETFKKGNVLISLMSQYTPNGYTEHIPGLNRRLTEREYELAEEYLFSTQLEDGYLQEPDSSGTEYVPRFDLTEI